MCYDYAGLGSAHQDAMDYEENARYDRWDGYREDTGLLDWECEGEDPGCPVCGYRDDCEGCKEHARYVAELDRPACDDVPF